MIIIKNNRADLNPLIDVVDHEDLVPDLLEMIEEYMLANKVRTVYEDNDQEVFFISGLSEVHHQALSEYLNNYAFEDEEFEAVPVSGSWGDFPAAKHWLDIDGLIVDIGFSDLKDRTEDLPEYYDNFQTCNCFISDNPKNVLYNLYRV
jgi:hypothetical protein